MKTVRGVGLVTLVYVIRHGETAWNRKSVFRGRRDVPLDRRGALQAGLTAAALSGVELSGVYSSPLRRAVQTARRIAAPRGLDVTILPELTDMDFGDWEGRSHEQVARIDPEGLARWMQRPERSRAPNGESLAMARLRARAGLKRAIRENPGGTAVLVTHRVLCKLLLCEALGIGNEHFWAIRQDVCGISAIRCEGGRLALLKLNDTCHLKGEGGGLADF
jgi:broad specificity phosphatase PhoE